MITECKIKKLLDEHVKNMNNSFEGEIVFAKLHFIAGAIAILKIQNNSDFRFMNKIEYKDENNH